MPAMVKFFHMSPRDYWGLTVREYNALATYMTEYAKQMEKANRG